MRKLNTSDIFSACRLLSAIGVREELKEVALKAEESNTKKVKAEVGFDLIFGILEKATKEKSEEEIYKFIANLFECEWQEVRDMDPVDMLEKLEQVAEIDKWKNFFKRVAALMKKK